MKRSSRLFFLRLLVCAGFCLPFSIHAQLVQDSLIVQFDSTAVDVQSFGIVSIRDLRTGDPAILGITEVERYLFIPVDLLIQTRQSLSAEMLDFFASDKAEDSPQFSLDVHDFRLIRKPGLLCPHDALYADVEVHQKDETGHTTSLGHLLYETTRRTPLFHADLKTGLESVMQDWQKDLAGDLTMLAEDSHPVRRLRTEHPVGRLSNLYMGPDVTAMVDGWIWDVQVYLSAREAKRSFFRSGGYHLRYRAEEDFDAIEFSLSTDYWMYRLNPKWLFRAKSQIFLGINRWDDMDTHEHKAWDIILLDASLSQMIQFNPLGKKSVVFGLGLMESFSYIYSKGFRFQPGVMISAGVKL